MPTHSPVSPLLDYRGRKNSSTIVLILLPVPVVALSPSPYSQGGTAQPGCVLLSLWVALEQLSVASAGRAPRMCSHTTPKALPGEVENWDWEEGRHSHCGVDGAAMDSYPDL